jgi:hypothetical protein
MDSYISRQVMTLAQILVNWSRLSEQNFRFDKWSVCRG